MTKRLHHILILMLIAFASPLAQAAPVVKAHLDSTTLLMGRMGTMQLTVEEAKNVKGHFVLFNQLRERGYASVCGDSVELRAPARIDTVDMGKQRKIVFTVPIQAFDSGAYVLPEIEYVAGKDTARSNKVALKVVPVKARADEAINDYAGTADPEDPSFWDWVPDWVIDFWWLVIIILLAIGAFIYAMMRYRKQGSLLPKKPEPTPYEEAVTALRQLKAKDLWQQGMEKEYFTELTEILRRYLYRRFGINAMEMTSREILNSLKHNEETKDKRAYFRKILDVADFVKFAKVRPLPDDNIASYDAAVRFVEETKPAPVAEDEKAKENVKHSRKGKKMSVKKGGKA